MGITCFAGVPDSLLKPFSDAIYRKHGLNTPAHRVCANEGGAVGLAAGHFLATGQPACVYMQNSGIGNAVNPIVSLLNEKVYGIPCLFVVGWRGEPGVKDEPQHAFQGEITKSLLENIGVTCFGINSFAKAKNVLDNNGCAAIIVKAGELEGENAKFVNKNSMTREEALSCIMKKTTGTYVTTTGKTSREWFEIRQRADVELCDFLAVGSMGHAIMIALGIKQAKPQETVLCLDGDGAALMHLGSLRVVAASGVDGLVHVVFNNGAHESVGGMDIGGGAANFAEIGKALGYSNVFRVESIAQLENALQAVSKNERGVTLIEVMVAIGSRPDLGRPTQTPAQNRDALMEQLV